MRRAAAPLRRSRPATAATPSSTATSTRCWRNGSWSGRRSARPSRRRPPAHRVPGRRHAVAARARAASNVCSSAFDGHLTPQAEVTVETNPEDVTAGYAAWAAGRGIRVSLGAQSFVPRLRAALGRRAEADPAAAFRRLRAAGCANVGLDLIFGIPGQTAAELDADLARGRRAAAGPRLLVRARRDRRDGPRVAAGSRRSRGTRRRGIGRRREDERRGLVRRGTGQRRRGGRIRDRRSGPPGRRHARRDVPDRRPRPRTARLPLVRGEQLRRARPALPAQQRGVARRGLHRPRCRRCRDDRRRAAPRSAGPGRLPGGARAAGRSERRAAAGGRRRRRARSSASRRRSGRASASTWPPGPERPLPLRDVQEVLDSRRNRAARAGRVRARGRWYTTGDAEGAFRGRRAQRAPVSRFLRSGHFPKCRRVAARGSASQEME